MRDAPNDPVPIPPLINVQNFRAIPAFRVTGNRRIRHNCLWRSASLDELTLEECQALQLLDIKTIADLRSAQERSDLPTPVHLRSIAALFWEIESAAETSQKLRADLGKAAEVSDVQQLMLNLYKQLPNSHSTQLGDIYRAIAQGGIPMLIHCAAGKDRTGVVIAILLDFLGVDREAIYDDYEVSEQLLDPGKLARAAAIGLRSWSDAGMMSPDLLKPLFRADRIYLSAAFDSIAERYSSMEEYFTSRLGLDDVTLRHLHDRLTEPTTE